MEILSFITSLLPSKMCCLHEEKANKHQHAKTCYNGPKQGSGVPPLTAVSMLPPPRAFKHCMDQSGAELLSRGKDTDACWLISKICLIDLDRKQLSALRTI